jgi:membrane-bound inhibitor of C-type lysozyme
MRIALATIAMMLACASAHGAGKAKYFAVDYVCNGGVKLRAAYPDDPLSGQSITLRYSSKRVVLQPALAASGARYENQQRHLEWWIKGNDGTLSDTKAGKPLLHCSSPSSSK